MVLWTDETTDEDYYSPASIRDRGLAADRCHGCRPILAIQDEISEEVSRA